MKVDKEKSEGNFTTSVPAVDRALNGRTRFPVRLGTAQCLQVDLKEGAKATYLPVLSTSETEREVAAGFGV